MLSNIDIIIPAADKIQKYEDVVLGLYQKVFSNERENVFLSTIRDTLLPKLMSGEIDVDERVNDVRIAESV